MNAPPRPIILITFHPTHAGIIQALQALGKYRVVVFGGEEFLRHVDLRREAAEAEARRRVSEWIQAVRQCCGRRSYRVYGRDVTREVVHTLESLVLHHFPNFLAVAEGFESLHRAGPIGAVVLHEEVTPAMRLLIALADRHHIPSLHLPHAIALSRFPLKDFHDRIRATLVGAHGAFERAWFLQNPKNDPSRIVLVGRPEWDRFYQQALMTREEACRIIGLDPSRRVVGFAGSWAHRLTTVDLDWLLREAFRDFLIGIRQLEGEPPPQVIVRPHPAHAVLGNYGPPWHQALAEEVGVPILVPDVAAETFLAASDLIVGLDSNFLIMALLARKVALSIAWQQQGVGTRSGYDGLPGIATCRRDRRSIAAALERCLLDEEYRRRLAAGRDETLKALNFGHDGRATERVVALIEAMIQEAEERCP